MSAYPVLVHTAIDATDCRGLAEFYRQFLGLRYRPGADGSDDDPGWLVLPDPAGRRVFAFQEVPAPRPADLARP
jgi:Glyoxalase-like domain